MLQLTESALCYNARNKSLFTVNEYLQRPISVIVRTVYYVTFFKSMTRQMKGGSAKDLVLSR